MRVEGFEPPMSYGLTGYSRLHYRVCVTLKIELRKLLLLLNSLAIFPFCLMAGRVGLEPTSLAFQGNALPVCKQHL